MESVIRLKTIHNLIEFNKKLEASEDGNGASIEIRYHDRDHVRMIRNASRRRINKEK